ncbi:MAG: Peroxide-responsive repressor PerR [Verrucomicrobia subdivision 3 bacterium]|nr:Peroxide-responsive repressor PerR [Limisphaerales bacterium]MCS1415002.1 Peroxide-responsive repressor PerR [Limisphaerales bacterium]
MNDRHGATEAEGSDFAKKLSDSGLRLTTQRKHVYHILLAQMDHPTADEVYLRAKAEKPEISMATVYNSLDALVKCGLVKQVNVDRAATRYCSNMEAHCHFYCEECGGVHDIELSGGIRDFPIRLPRDLSARQMDVSIRGVCKDPKGCSRRIAKS